MVLRPQGFRSPVKPDLNIVDKCEVTKQSQMFRQNKRYYHQDFETMSNLGDGIHHPTVSQ